MKIIATCRTFNEEHNIERFVKAHKAFADEVFIVDGVSNDLTVQLALEAGAKVSIFGEMIQAAPGGKRNPHGRHINFCIDWAWREGADWVIFDDCDDVPTLALQKKAREIFEATRFDCVNVYRLYLYGENQYYPDLNMPGQSIWAWRRGQNIRASETNPFAFDMLGIPAANQMLMLEHPLSCLHYTWPTEEEITRKIAFYHSTGEGTMGNHPDVWAGPRRPLPDWAKWQ